jgi:hypothetical protein
LKQKFPDDASKFGVEEIEDLVDLSDEIVPEVAEELKVEEETSVEDPDEYMKRYVHEHHMEKVEPVRLGMVENK